MWKHLQQQTICKMQKTKKHSSIIYTIVLIHNEKQKQEVSEDHLKNSAIIHGW